MSALILWTVFIRRIDMCDEGLNNFALLLVCSREVVLTSCINSSVCMCKLVFIHCYAPKGQSLRSVSMCE